MKASQLISELQRLIAETGADPEVGAQSHGCCNHAHELKKVEMGGSYMPWATSDEIGMIVIRA